MPYTHRIQYYSSELSEWIAYTFAFGPHPSLPNNELQYTMKKHPSGKKSIVYEIVGVSDNQVLNDRK